MKKAFYVLILSIAFCIISPYIFASEGGYNIQRYDVDIIVGENNVLDITETINVNFTESRHGIYRNIPTSNKVERLDGTSSTNRVKITDINVNNDYETSYENGNKVIKIGNANSYANNNETYVISYKYDIGDDGVSDFDELYFNIIGTEWDCTIQNVKFNISMPKDFDSSTLGFSTGLLGSSNSNDVKYNVNGRTISGYVKKSLDIGEGLTVRLKLPEGYFVGERSQNKITILFAAIFACIVAVVVAIKWRKYGKDDMVVDTVEFYPPQDYTSADVGFVYKGGTDNKQIVSLIVYFANKGYLKIEEIDKKTFKLIKIKDYDEEGKNAEKRTFDGLFKNKDEVTKDDLTDKFYRVVIDADMELLARYSSDEKRLYTKASKKHQGLSCVFGFLSAFALIATIIYEYTFELGTALGIGAVVSFFGYFFSFAIISLFTKSAKPITGIIISAIMISVGIYLAFALDISMMYACVGLTALFISEIFASITDKRSEYGTQMLGKIEGFKDFLNRAEKEQLEAMVNKDPQYFYNILPYAYVLDVSDVWMKKFENIAIPAPSWYDTNNTFNIIAFNSFMNNTMSTARESMTSSPQSSSSGGGFSGGGSGGGGGGSW